MQHLLSFSLGIVGNLTAVLVLVSPMPTFWLIFKSNTTASFSPQPYLFSLLSALFWTYYGILKKGGIFVLTISAITCAFQVFYLSLYVWFGTHSQRRKTALIFSLIVAGYVGIVISTMKLEHGNEPLITFGLLSTATAVLSNAAPLTIMHKVVKTRSVKYMPFALSFGLFVNGAAWLAYAISVQDTFLKIPNAIGTSLAAIQLMLYGFYKLYGVKSQVIDENLGETMTTLKKMEACKDSPLPALQHENAIIVAKDSNAKLNNVLPPTSTISNDGETTLFHEITIN